MTQEILEFCLKRGFLLDKEILSLFKENDPDSVKLIIEKMGSCTQQKIITKNIFQKHKDQVSQFFSNLPMENQRKLENLKIKLGLSIEISKSEVVATKPILEESQIKVESYNNEIYHKLEVKNFVTHFRNRFIEMRNVLQGSSELGNLVSVNKLQNNRSNVSLIGLVSDKRVTKNKNILLEVEDLTGKIKVLINKDKEELLEKAEELTLDAVVGIKGSGNREIFFANDLLFPDVSLPERKSAFVEEYALFIGDLHFGSKKFLKKSFLKFIDYINGDVPDTPEVEKIKYLFIVGDVVAGVGNYPNQENDLLIKDLEEQFVALADLLGKIRKDIKIIISPGNHDGVRLMEPQPVFDEKFAWPLYELENVISTSNPAAVNIASRKGFSGFDVLTYHGVSFLYYADNINRLMLKKAAHKPEMIMKYLLKNRHLAPTHSSTQYFPLEKDALMIRKVPDVVVSGHLHKSAVAYHNNVLIISVSTWESISDYMEKVGSKPDFCKVPMLNLKTRAVKILDFEGED